MRGDGYHALGMLEVVTGENRRPLSPDYQAEATE